jgi:hypothetical protein
MAAQFKILARSPAGPLSRKTGSGALVYRVLTSPSDPPPATPPPGASGYWFYYVVFFGADNLVIYGAGSNRSGHVTNGGGQSSDSSGSDSGGSYWADLHLYIQGSTLDQHLPPQLRVTDAFPGYSEGTFDSPASFFGGSRMSANGSIQMALFWYGTLIWVPPS